MKNVFFIVFMLLLNTGEVRSQPGYFGHKNLVEAQVSFAPLTLIRGSASVTRRYGFNAERATSDHASWLVSFGMGSTFMEDYALDLQNNYMYLTDPQYNPSQYYASNLQPSGMLNFKFSEFGVQRRWYLGALGAVAPYGTFIGVDANVAQCKITSDQVTFYSQSQKKTVMFKEETPISHSAVSISAVFGKRRILAEHLSLGYNISIGYFLTQTSQGSMLFGGETENYMEWQESVMMRHFSNTRLLQFSLNLGYVW